MAEYAFDCVLTVALRVTANSEAEARAILNDKLDCADSNFGAWPDGSPILGEASISDDSAPDLYEIDGNAV